MRLQRCGTALWLSAATTLAGTAAVPGQAAEPVAEVRWIASDSKQVEVPVPAGWNCKIRQRDAIPAASGEVAMVLAMTVEMPGVGTPLAIGVHVLNGTSLTPLGQCGYEHAIAARRDETDAQHMFAEPIPHLVIRRHGLGDPTQDLIYIFRRVRGRGLQLSVYCARDEWAKVKPWVCRAFLDTRVAYPHWPAPVVGRKVQMSGGVGVSIGAGVDPKQIKIIHHCFAAVEKRLSGWHGPPIRSATEPFVVHVNLTRDGHAAMTGAGDRFEISGGVRERRALTVPIGPRGSRTRASLVNEAAATYLGDLYGVQNPYWMHVGERLLAKIADETGKDLPYVTTAFAASVGLLDGTFADLAADRNIRRDRRDDHCIAYVALLRSGPSIYKKAYKAFLAELRQTCNSPAAVARHLLVLDQPRMLEDVRALVKKLRPIEVKAR